MPRSEAIEPESDLAALFPEEDLRLVIEAIGEVSAANPGGGAAVGRSRIDSDRARRVIRRILGSDARKDASVSVYVDGGADDLFLQFDMDAILEDIRRSVAAGIGRDRQLLDFIGGLPPAAAARLDAARSAPRLAGHLASTAADHVVWALRVRLQEILVPLHEDGRKLSWRGSIGKGALPIGEALPFATEIRMDVTPETMETFDVQ